MSFRQYGGINYAAKNNVVKNNYANVNNLSVMTKVGQPNTYINFESDISGNILVYGDFDLSGNLHVAGDIDCSGNLYTDKDAYINSVRVGRGAGNSTSNTVVGNQALFSNTTGSDNVAIGYRALVSNTTGNNNTASGVNALYINQSGSNNVANGNQSLFSNTIGNYNTANGESSLYNNTTGLYNTAIGSGAGFTNSTGSNNTYIGRQADCSPGSLSNATAIGNGASVTGSNKIRIGNTAVSVIEVQVALTVTSDARDKTNFVPLDAGLNFINELNPIRFDWNQRGGGLEGRKDIGFTAQELLLAQEKTKISIPNLVDESNPDKYYVMYTQLIPILVKSVQEMSSTITRLEGEINELKLKIS